MKWNYVIVIIFFAILPLSKNSEAQYNSGLINKVNSSDEGDLIADAGNDFTVKKGQVIKLDGTNSRSKNDDITSYHWEIVEKPVNSYARIFKSKRVKTNFLADATGIYQVQLTVVNGSGLKAIDSIMITSDALNVNSKPVAIISNFKSELLPNERIILDATESYDPDRLDRLSYRWVIEESPLESEPVLTKPTSKKTHFSAEKGGVYKIALVVSDNHGLENKTLISMSVKGSNQAPVAHLGDDKNHTLGADLKLACKSCYDPDGDQITYTWGLIQKPLHSNADLLLDTTANPILTPDMEGEYLVNVRVSDGEFSSVSNTQTINAKTNQKPVSVITAEQNVTLGDVIKLDARHSFDPEGAGLNYEWELISQPGNDIFELPDTVQITALPTHLGQYTFSLRTYDGDLFSELVTQTITVSENLPPVIKINNTDNLIGNINEEVNVDASQSYDPEGESLSFNWELLTPQGSNASIVDSNSVNLQFIPDISGDYILRLTVSDPWGNTAFKEVSISVKDEAIILSGVIKGRIVDTTLNGVPNATIHANDIPYVTNIDGFYEIFYEVEKGSAVELKTSDYRLVTSESRIENISQDNQIINLGESFIPNNQLVDTYVWECNDYTGPKEVTLNFKMLNTFPEMDTFKTNYEEQFNFIVGENRELLLPSTATYEVKAKEESYFVASDPIQTIYYSPLFGAINIIYICNN